MDGMARSCGVDIPDTEGEPYNPSGILQNAGGSVKPYGVVCTTGQRTGNSEMGKICESSTRGLHRTIRNRLACRSAFLGYTPRVFYPQWWNACCPSDSSRSPGLPRES